MSVQLEEQIRNFCPHCMKKSKSILYCTNCANSDLIPEPEIKVNIPSDYTPETESIDGIILTKEEEDLIIGAIPLQALPKEKSFVEIVKDEYDKLEHFKVTDANRFQFLTGEGGSGKTFLTRKRAHENPRYIELCSTTGIAAVNLGGRTVHSTLGFFNTKSLRNNWESGKLQYKLRKVRQNKDVLGIEECSMLPAEQLDLIVNAVDEINNDRSGKVLGVHLIGDFAQLPPVKKPPENAEFCFKAECWPRFDQCIEKLTKIWRQDNPDFIKALNFARKGDGNSAVTALLDCGVRFEDKIDNWFAGTTLIPKNDDVDFYNIKRLNQINSPMIRTTSRKEGVPLGEWDKLIPIELRVKKDAYVMILSNDIPDFNYVNGDTGWVKDYDEKKGVFKIELKRTGTCVNIGRIKRHNLTDRAPSPDNFKAGFSPYVDLLTGDWVIGTISYHPLRLAYASTIHKAQGLSLDLLQIDSSVNFFSHPGMGYVSLSRARTPEGLVIVGKPQDVAKKIKCSPEILRWI